MYFIICVLDLNLVEKCLYCLKNRPVARTRFMERIRHSVNNSRIQRGGYIIETDDEASSDSDEDGSESVSSATSSHSNSDEPEPESDELAPKQCSCIMCDESCQVIYKPMPRTKIQRKTTKKTTRRRVKRAGKTSRKSKRRVKRGRRRRKVLKRGSSAPVTTQTKILMAIRAAKQQQIESAKESNGPSAITMSSIELELMKKQSGGKEYRAPRFPVRAATAWYEDSILNGVDV